MKKAERDALLKWAETLTDEELEKKYYDSVFDSLGSQTEEMYERGYDIADIKEREKYEKYLAERCSLLETVCIKRNLKLWDEEKEDSAE